MPGGISRFMGTITSSEESKAGDRNELSLSLHSLGGMNFKFLRL
jgi:hypothetical protein